MEPFLIDTKHTALFDFADMKKALAAAKRDAEDHESKLKAELKAASAEAAAAGLGHSMVLKQDGSVWATGSSIIRNDNVISSAIQSLISQFFESRCDSNTNNRAR